MYMHPEGKRPGSEGSRYTDRGRGGPSAREVSGLRGGMPSRRALTLRGRTVRAPRGHAVTQSRHSLVFNRLRRQRSSITTGMSVEFRSSMPENNENVVISGWLKPVWYSRGRQETSRLPQQFTGAPLPVMSRRSLPPHAATSFRQFGKNRCAHGR